MSKMFILVSFIIKFIVIKSLLYKILCNHQKNTFQDRIAIGYTSVFLGKLQSCNLPSPLTTQVQAYVLIDFEAVTPKVKTTVGNITHCLLELMQSF